MKIKVIDAENFKQHINIEIPMDKKNLAYVGVNGAGKTSVLEIIKYALTGDMPKEAINSDYDYMRAATVLQDGTMFERRAFVKSPSKVLVNGKNATAKGLNSLLQEKTGVSTDTMKVVTSGEVFENMKPDQFGKFILSYIPEKLDIDQIVKFAAPLTSEEEKELRMYFPEMPDTFDINQINSIYKECMDAKRITKKTLETKKANSQIFEGVAPARTIEAVENELESLMRQEGEEIAKRDKMAVYLNAKKIREEQERQIEEMEKQISRISATRPDPIIEAELQTKLQSAQKDVHDASFVLKQMQKSILIFEQQLKNLDSSICPLAEGLVCTTDKTELRESLEDSISSTKEGIEIQEPKIKDAEKTEKELQEKVALFQKNKIEYQRKVLLLSNLDNMKKNLIAVPEKPEDEATDFSKEKNALKEERKRIEQYEEHLKILKQIEYFEKRLEIYSTLTDRLSPKGSVMAKITDYYLSILEDVCNARAAGFKKDIRVKFIANDGVEIYAYNGKAKQPLRYSLLSEGERAYVLFLLIDMLNALSGLRILLLDDLEKLDQVSFNALLDILMSKEVQDEYDHIVIATVNHEGIVNRLKTYPKLEIINL